MNNTSMNDSYACPDCGQFIKSNIDHVCPGLPLKTAVATLGIKHPQVIAFAKAMDDVLNKNDHKGGWRNCTMEYLEARLVEEVGEYFREVANHSEYRDRYGKNKPVNTKELIDIANFAMMLWDRDGGVTGGRESA